MAKVGVREEDLENLLQPRETSRATSFRRVLAAGMLCLVVGVVGTGIAQKARFEAGTGVDLASSRGEAPKQKTFTCPREHVFGSRETGLFYIDMCEDDPHPRALECDLLDDDMYYPIRPGSDPSDGSGNCEVQDGSAEHCDACLSDPTCRELCHEATPLCENGDHDAAFEFIKPCMWQAIAQTPTLCKARENFTPTPPLSSRNAPPTADESDVATDANSWNCKFHSFCQTCADPTEKSGFNQFCLAAVLQYRGTFNVFQDIDGWCSPDNLAQFTTPKDDHQISLTTAVAT